MAGRGAKCPLALSTYRPNSTRSHRPDAVLRLAGSWATTRSTGSGHNANLIQVHAILFRLIDAVLYDNNVIR